MRGLAALLALVIGGCGGGGTADGPRPPNLVLIVSDDHGWPDFGFMGSEHVKTPHLDQLAREGVLFRRGFTTASVCRPSLRSLLTGLHPLQWRVRLRRHRDADDLEEGEQIALFDTLPRVLARHGYASFQAGKFWEVDYAHAGFTDGMQEGGQNLRWGGTGRAIGRDTLDPVLEFIDAHRDRPFFLWLVPELPHWPHDAAARYQNLYDDPLLSAEAVAYYANVSRLDDVVGRVVAHLDARGLRHDTIVAFLADNGWDQPPYERPPLYGLDGPRGKLSQYELGNRTPVILRGPGRVPAGVVSDALVSGVDLFPTLLDYAGVPAPAARPGHSLRALIEGGADAWPRSAVITGGDRVGFLRKDVDGCGGSFDPCRRGFEEVYVLRNTRWRYVWYRERERDELYDMRENPREVNDVSDQQVLLRRVFQQRIARWRRDMRRMVWNLPAGPS